MFIYNTVYVYEKCKQHIIYCRAEKYIIPRNYLFDHNGIYISEHTNRLGMITQTYSEQSDVIESEY